MSEVPEETDQPGRHSTLPPSTSQSGELRKSKGQPAYCVGAESSSKMIRSKSFQEYIGESDISIDQHVNLRIRDLGKALRSRRAIYLDTCFWIYLRNALEHGNDSEAGGLLECLREKAAAGLIFCPISDSIFVELMKQTDAASRSATTALIDELSLGVTLISEQGRAEMEVRRFVRANAGQLQSPPLDELVWCKLAYIMGVVHPYKTPFERSSERAIQKAFFDHTWTLPLSRVVDAMANVEIPGSDWTDLVNELNKANADNSGGLKSYRQTYKIEVRGAVDLVGDVAVETFFEVAVEKGAPPGRMTDELRSQTMSMLKSMLAISLDKGKSQSQLASLHILASLHASLRWNKQQKLDSHDIFDFQHATAALAYCDAFFTERPLSDMIKQNHLRLDQEFDCYVTSDVGEALAWVSGVPPLGEQAG